MEHKKKFYLVNIDFDGFKKEHKIIFEMPSFCSGDYEAVIYEDEKGLYIKKEDNYFEGCRDFEVVAPHSI